MNLSLFFFFYFTWFNYNTTQHKFQNPQRYLEDPGDGQREAGGSGHQQELREAQAEGQQATKAENEEGVAQRSQLCHPEQLVGGAEAQTCKEGTVQA